YMYNHLNLSFISFFLNDPATPAIYTLSLHDALPIWNGGANSVKLTWEQCPTYVASNGTTTVLSCKINGNAATSSVNVSVGSGSSDRKSTRLNSSHDQISYAVFCLKKKTKKTTQTTHT